MDASIRLVLALGLILCLAAGPASQPATRPSPARPDSSSADGLVSVTNGRKQTIRETSIDGTPYPRVTAQNWWSETKIPLIGQTIGSFPWDVNGGKVIALQSGNGTAQRARAYVSRCGVAVGGYEWVSGGLGGTFTLLKLDGGRVRGVCLLENNTNESWAKRIDYLAGAGLREKDGFRIGPLNYACRTTGSWTAKTLEKRGMDGRVVQEATSTEHPAALFIEVQPWDWVLATCCTSREMFDAAANERIEVGMTMQEAYLAMRKYSLKRIKGKEAGDEMWSWIKDEATDKSQRIVQSEYGTYVVSEQEIHQVVAARAEISAFHIVKFDWAIGE